MRKTTTRSGFAPALDCALSMKLTNIASVKQVAPGVYIFFDAFAKSSCRELLAEILRHKSAPPNSMNKYGVVLADIGLGPLCERLLNTFVNPFSVEVFPYVGRMTKVHGFLVNYAVGKQRALGAHFDDSDVTLNVCLGKSSAGGKLVFLDHNDRPQIEIGHKVGQAVLHLGAHTHQARAIRSGKRSNLILWCSRSGRK